MFHTPATRLLGIELPVLCGGMMWLSDARLVASIARAGGMGFLTCRSHATAAAFEEELARCRQWADGKPVGVNLTFSAHTDNSQLDLRARIALDMGVRHFETAGMAVPAPLLSRIRGGGGIVIHKCASLRHALAAERSGVDMVALVGMEEGGHPGAGALPTTVLAALAAGALRGPYIIGGGIGHGAQLVSALALGASGVVMGSRFLACHEVWAHDAYKQAIVHAGPDDTMTVLGSVGRTWRVLANGTAREVASREARGEREHSAFADLVAGTRTRERCYVSGDWQAGLLSAGPAIGFVHARQSVAETLDEFMAQASASLAALDSLSGQRRVAAGDHPCHP